MGRAPSTPPKQDTFFCVSVISVIIFMCFFDCRQFTLLSLDAANARVIPPDNVFMWGNGMLVMHRQNDGVKMHRLMVSRTIVI